MSKITQHISTALKTTDYVNGLDSPTLETIGLLSKIAGIQLSTDSVSFMCNYLQLVANCDTHLMSLEAHTSQTALHSIPAKLPNIFWDVLVYKTIEQIKLTALPTFVNSVRQSITLVPDAEGCKQFSSMLFQVSNDIARSSRRGAGNILLISPTQCKLLYAQHQFDISESQMLHMVHPTYIGQLNHINIVVVPNIDGLYLGYVGTACTDKNGQVDASLFVVPHIEESNYACGWCSAYDTIKYRKIVMQED